MKIEKNEFLSDFSEPLESRHFMHDLASVLTYDCDSQESENYWAGHHEGRRFLSLTSLGYRDQTVCFCPSFKYVSCFAA